MKQEQYKTLCTVNLNHSYYKDGLCKSIDLVPDDRTQQLLSDYRWLFKNTAHGGVVVFSAKSGGETPYIKVTKEVTLRFLLRLNDVNFCNFTQLPVKTNPTDIYYFANGVNNNEIATIAPATPVSNLFGILQITDTFNFSAPLAYNFQCSAKSLPWNYIIVLKKDYPDCTFTIEDTEDPAGENPYPFMQFTQTGGGTTHAKGDTLVFTSGSGTAPDFQLQTIPYYETPKKQLQLNIVNPDTGDTITRNNLANPSVEYPKPEIYIYV